MTSRNRSPHGERVRLGRRFAAHRQREPHPDLPSAAQRRPRLSLQRPEQRHASAVKAASRAMRRAVSAASVAPPISWLGASPVPMNSTNEKRSDPSAPNVPATCTATRWPLQRARPGQRSPSSGYPNRTSRYGPRTRRARRRWPGRKSFRLPAGRTDSFRRSAWSTACQPSVLSSRSRFTPDSPGAEPDPRHVVAARPWAPARHRCVLRRQPARVPDEVPSYVQLVLLLEHQRGPDRPPAS